MEEPLHRSDRAGMAALHQKLDICIAAGLADVPYLEFPFDPPEWSLTRRDFPLQIPCDVDSKGWINLSDAPGMGFDTKRPND